MVLFREKLVVNRNLVIFFAVITGVCIVLHAFVNRMFIIGVGLGLFFVILSLLLRLEVIVYKKKIEYKLMLFHLKPRTIWLKDVESLQVEPYRGTGVYGFKVKTTSEGALYYFGGHEILRIVTKNKQVYMISTHRGDELKLVLEGLV